MLKILVAALMAASPAFSAAVDAPIESGGSTGQSVMGPGMNSPYGSELDINDSGGAIFQGALNANQNNLIDYVNQGQIGSNAVPTPAMNSTYSGVRSKSYTAPMRAAAQSRQAVSQGAAATQAISKNAAATNEAVPTELDSSNQISHSAEISVQAAAPGQQTGVQAKAELNQTAGTISAAQAQGNIGAEEGALKQTYDDQNTGMAAGSSQTAGQSITGTAKAADLVSVAAGVPAEQSPDLFKAAIGAVLSPNAGKTSVVKAWAFAEKILPHMANGARPIAGFSAKRIEAAAILTAAVFHAKKALPQLANKAVEAAVKPASDDNRKILDEIIGVGPSGESDAMQMSAPGALDRWQALLKQARFPIINLSDLKNYVQSLQDGARLQSGALPTVGFSLRRKGFVADLPPLAVPADIPASVAIAALAIPEQKTLAVIDPNIAQRLSSHSEFSKYLRERGASVVERVEDEIGYALADLSNLKFRHSYRPLGAALEVSPGKKRSVLRNFEFLYNRAMEDVPPSRDPGVADVLIFLMRARGVAFDYGLITGDASAEQIAVDVTKRVFEIMKRDHLSPKSQASLEILSLIGTPGQEGDTLIYWLSRIHERAAAAAS